MGKKKVQLFERLKGLFARRRYLPERSSRSVSATSGFTPFRRGSTPTGNYSGIYTALDYPSALSYNDFDFLYRRQDIAQRIIKYPVATSWRHDPVIEDSFEDDTHFEQGINDLATNVNLYYNLYKTDLLAMIGRYSILFLGFDDNRKASEGVTRGSELVYVTPIPEPSARIATWDTNIESPRFGMPLSYQITFPVGDGSQQVTYHVNWSRVIHVAENTLDGEVYGIPALNHVYNRLLGLEKLAGGSPEVYWRGARPGYTANSMPNSVTTQEALDSISEQLSSFSNNYTRWIYTQGLDIKALAPQVATPLEHVDVQLQLISAATGIPKRILTGSERGELSSTQDERNWLKIVEERRVKVCENKLLMPFVDRMLAFGIIPPAKSGEYTIEWEPLVVASEKERAEIGYIKTQALTLYQNSPGADMLVPEDQFKEEFLGMSEMSIEQAKDVLKDEVDFDSKTQ